MIRSYMNWSGGKDSSLCLYRVLQDKQYKVDYLLTNVNSFHDRISMHGVRRDLLKTQAASIGLPLQTIELPEQPGMQEYERAMSEKIARLKNEGCTHALFGDIFLEDLRHYREEKLQSLDIHCVFPLWKIPTIQLMKEFIGSGFRAIVVCVNEKWLDRSFCGRLIDEGFLADLPEDVDPCGENGEYHSFVFDGPIFASPIPFKKGEIVHRQYKAPATLASGATVCNPMDQPSQTGFYFCDLLPGALRQLKQVNKMPVQTVTGKELRTELQHKIDSKTKPLGALGRLEDIALQVGLIQGTNQPRITRPHMIVFAGDHGIAATGLVNPFPQAVTAQMVLNFIHGGAAINVFCRQHGLGLTVVDAGVNAELGNPSEASDLIHAKIGYGTRNYLEGDAMSREEVQKAIAEGKKITETLFHTGCNSIGLGEMGIGNTSSAALIMSFITGIPIEECVGRGTGVDDEQLERKIATLRKVYDLHEKGIALSPDAFTILQHIGGFEIAMMVGACLRAAELNMLIVVDGFISTAALLLAKGVNPSVPDFCIFAHTSGERGHQKMLQWLGARPLLDLGMRLGEGSGAAMAFPLIRSALAFLEEMASFESAGVSNKE